MAVNMVPPIELRPTVLPADRLNRKGMAVGELRADLRRIRSWRNAFTLAGALLQSFGLIVLTDRLVERTGWWWLWIATFLLMGRAHALLGILGHESAHKLLFSNQKLNDLAGQYLVNGPTFVSQEAYRRSHMTHHRAALGLEEPDKSLYADYPVARAALRRKLRRDATGESGWKIVRALVRSARNPIARPALARIVVTQIVLAVVLGVLVDWWAWPLLWFAPWMTVWRVINRLRAIAEHGGMVESDDERSISHVVRQSWTARFWMVPYHTGWHLAHHVDAGIPWRNLPRFHEELVRAGYVVPGLEHRSYVALWRELASGRQAA